MPNPSRHGGHSPTHWSYKAVAAATLSSLHFVFVLLQVPIHWSAIAAVLGVTSAVTALRDIQQQPNRVKGRLLSYYAIALGGLILTAYLLGIGTTGAMR